MIVSHKHGFVFVQVPQTASTFLGRFFVDQFDGNEVLKKHATYAEFLEVATPAETSYRRIIGKRHPLDKAATRYARQVAQRGITHPSVEALQANFEAWFREKYVQGARNRWNPHIKQSYPFCDGVIRQEKLESDLLGILDHLKLATVEIPRWSKKTASKLQDYSLYYSDALLPEALDAFRDEMDLLEYEVPAWCRQRVASDGAI